MTNEEKNKYICEKLGIHWHDKDRIYWDGQYYRWICLDCNRQFNILYELEHSNPDFTTDHGRAELLRILLMRTDWEDIIQMLKGANSYLYQCIPIDYITEPEGGTMLLDAVVKYFKERRKNEA